MASYEQHPKTGLWSVRYMDVDENGTPKKKRHSGHFKTKKAAMISFEAFMEKKKEEDQAREEAKKNEQPARPIFLFEDLGTKFFEHKKTRVRESTIVTWESRYKSRILPFFKDIDVVDITLIKATEWIDSLSKDAYNYQKNTITLFCSILKFGAKYFNLPNISPKIDRPKNNKKKKEMLVWSPEEFQAFIKCVDDPMCYALFWSLYVLGMRIGEATALTWNDYDFKKRRVSINKGFSRKVNEITDPKNDGSIRTVPFPEYYGKIMQEYKEWQRSNCDSTEYVFGGSKPASEMTIARRKDAAVEESGVKRIRIHDFRHSCATLLIHSRVPIVAISRYLGHKNVTETLNTYGHLMPDSHDIIISALETINAAKP